MEPAELLEGVLLGRINVGSACVETEENFNLHRWLVMDVLVKKFHGSHLVWRRNADQQGQLHLENKVHL